jgi:hypothetical protein
MFMRLILLPAVLAAALAAATGTQHARADALADAVATVPGEVEEIRFAGSWTEGDESGIYRIVLTRSGSPIAARLFVQWIAVGNEGPRVAHSIEIAELGALNIDVLDFSGETDADGLAVHIESVDGDAYELFVTKPDEYRFGRASN